MSLRTVTISVIGVSGKDSVKGNQGVGKSVLCNRFVRSDYDDFIIDHSSVLSQTDFGGSPVINNDHWLYWGERVVEYDDYSSKAIARVIEQTEFLDDETYDTLAGPYTAENYGKRATRIKLESRDKLMYIRKEQLGLEAEFPQLILADGKCSVDCFIFVFDSSRNDRSFDSQINSAHYILTNAIKTKKPVIIAISKCDIYDEECKRALQNLLSKKELKAAHIPIVETSAVSNINVEEVFSYAVSMVIKSKSRVKIHSYADSEKSVKDRNVEIRNSFVRLLRDVLPLNRWPEQRLSWTSLVRKLNFDRHPDYCSFVHNFGIEAAVKVYESHVNEAREYWMASRLRNFFHELPRVFDSLLDKSIVPEITWNEAKRIIHSHALFDEYFQPLGALGKNLDPRSPDELNEDPVPDSRIPAEILLRSEARIKFEGYQKNVEMEFRKERLEEDFEAILQECPQITPGKPLQEVSSFLQEFEAYRLLPPAQAFLIYDRYQTVLKQRAEKEFSECLHEHIELFIESLRNKKCVSGGRLVSEVHFNKIKDYLQEDYRFRQLSRMFELRDSRIHQFISFILNPSPSQCAARTRCSDVQLLESMNVFFQRRQQAKEMDVHLVDISVYGDISLVAQFITDLNRLLRNEPFLSSSGFATIRCFGPDESGVGAKPKTQLYLLDTPNAVEEARACFQNYSKDESGGLPPVFVLVCDPGHYDLLPTMHQQGSELAEETEGIFIGAGSAESSDSNFSRGSDCSSIFGRDQLYRVCETICSSQLDRRRCDLRVRTSILCGDPFGCETFLSFMFPLRNRNVCPLINPSLLSAGIIPVDICLETGTPRVDFMFGSYHNWLFTRTNAPIHGHIFMFSARRPASYAFARAAMTKVLDNDRYSVPGQAILLVAISDIHDHYDDEQHNLLLTSATELSQSISCSFIVVTPESVNDLSSSATFLKFISGLKDMVPVFDLENFDQERIDSDGYTAFGSQHSSKEDLSIYSSGPSGSCAVPSVVSNSNSGTSHSPKYDIHSPAGDSTSSKSSLAGVSSITGGSSNKPRRRPPPSNVALKITGVRTPEVAPLATPEAIELAPEYSQTQDALTDDDNVYATADFVSPVKPDESLTSLLSKKDKKYNLRSWMFSQPQTSQTSVPTPTTSVYSYAYEKTPSRTAPLFLIPASSPSEKRLPILLTPSNIKSTSTPTSVTQPINPILRKTVAAKSVTTKTYQMPRSITMDIINRDSVVKARQSVILPARPALRQSISAESLADLLLEKKKKSKEFGGSKFVRKVATSFRFKRNDNKIDHDSDKDDDPKSLSVPGSQPSRSLPQSPHTDRRVKKSGPTGTSEKSSFSWLPSISPRRSTKAIAVETTASGVVSPSDTIHSLTSEGGDIPIFLKRCVEFIEKDGGLELEGLYRVPGNQAQLMELEKFFRDKGDLDLAALNLPVHVVATAVKNFFSCLPEPLLTYDLHESLLSALSGDNVANEYKRILSNLPPANLLVLQYLMKHFHKVASSPSTAMDLINLSKVWFPTFFRPKFDNFQEMSEGMAKYQTAMEALLTHSNEIFCD